MKGTLGLTGLTMNAMALIAPGAFLWLTFQIQSTYGAPMAGFGMWFGILAALLLCYATAVSYAELSKLYPGAGSSYFFAEQAFLSKTHAYKFARLSKFITGWASHLYYWGYPGLMVGVTATLVGYMAGQIWPETFSPAVSSPTLMMIFCVFFSFGVAYIAYRGVVGATGVNIAINIVQISALLIFSFIAIGYRMSHPDGSDGWTLDPDGNPTNLALDTFKVDSDGNPVGKDSKSLLDKDGNLPESAVAMLIHDDGGKSIKGPNGEYIPTKDDKGNPAKFKLDYSKPVDQVALDASKPNDKVDTFQYHGSAASVVQPHALSFMFVQACIAILILVGFESVTSMGEEAKDPKRHIPWAVLLSLTIQGAICYLIEYFAANYALNNGYTMPNAAASSAPIGDMMKLVGSWLFGSPTAGIWFMRIQALTVFLALIGTTLSCMNTGARVTYAMGRDDEVPSHFGMLHGKNLTPHRAIWTLAAISMVIGIITVMLPVCSPFASADLIPQITKDQQGSFWYPMSLIPDLDHLKSLPNTLVTVTLVSNFGTFLLYMLTCIVAIVAFREHHSFNTFKHTFIPVFGLIANLGCMLFYIVGPAVVPNMSPKEPLIALGVVALWGLYGWFYFARSSSKKGRTAFLTPEHKAALTGATPMS
jgi:APA family basic amino acid/polyamine antiporter